MPAPLAVAVLAFTATSDIRANTRKIRHALVDAARSTARLLLTCECALIGYPSAGRRDLIGIDWQEVFACEQELMQEAHTLGIALVLGSASPAQTGSSQPAATPAITNDAVVLDGGLVLLRYRKRCLTPLDRLHFVAGNATAPSLCRIAGWSLGISICFEVRFGRICSAQAVAGADGFLHLAHMAGLDQDPGVKASVLPGIYGARAAEWATPLLLANTSQADRWLDSGLWDARGTRVQTLADGLMLTQLHAREDHAPWYTQVRDQALASEERSQPPTRA